MKQAVRKAILVSITHEGGMTWTANHDCLVREDGRVLLETENPAFMTILPNKEWLYYLGESERHPVKRIPCNENKAIYQLWLK